MTSGRLPGLAGDLKHLFRALRRVSAICIFQPPGQDTATSPLDSSDAFVVIFYAGGWQPNSVRALRMQFGEAASFPQPPGLRIAPTFATALNPQTLRHACHKIEDCKQSLKSPRQKRLNRHGACENPWKVGILTGDETGSTAAARPKSTITGAMALRGAFDHEFWLRGMANLLQAGPHPA